MELRALSVFVASCLLLIVAGASEPAKLELESLCANKHIELTRRSQVRALVEQLRGERGNACPSRLRLALVELDQLINDSELSDVCSLAEVEKIKAFYDKYIGQSLEQPSDSNEAQASGELPSGLKKFVLGYGLKVSSLCKKNMINSLQYESRALLTADDFRQIDPWTDEKSAISSIMDEPTDYDDLLLPRDIERVLRECQQSPGSDQAQADEKIFLQTATGRIIKRTQAICERRFKPLYEQLIMPLIYLSNLGFNYRGEDLEREMQEMSVNKEIHQWYRIVYLCETMNGIEIVEDPADSHRTEGTDKRLVRILSKEEAAKLKEELQISQAHEQQTTNHPEQVLFEPQYGNKLDDQVIDLADRNFVKLLHSFATHKGELERIRARLLRKMAKFVFDLLKKRQFKIIGSLLGNKQQAGSGNSNDDMVKLLDDYVSQLTSGDAPVAGAGKLQSWGKRLYHQAAYNGVSGITSKVKKNTLDKATINRYFWWFVSLALFIAGVVALIVG